MMNIAAFEQGTGHVADQKFWDALDGIDQSRTGALSDADLPDFEQLLTAEGARGGAVKCPPSSLQSALDELNGSGNLNVDRWTTMVMLADMSAQWP